MSRPVPQEMVVVGKVGRPHGVRGEVRVWPFAEDSESLYDVETVFIAEDVSGPYTTYRVRLARAADKTVLLGLDGIGDRDRAEALKGKLVLVRKEDLPALTDPDEFYHHELVGRPVVTDGGEALGVVEEIFTTGGGDVLVVRDRDRDQEILIPFVAAFVALETEPARLRVTLPEGLLEATTTPIDAQGKPSS